MGQSQRTRAEGARRYGDHQCHHHRPFGGSSKPISASGTVRIAGIGKAGNPDIQPGRRYHHRPGHRGDRGRGQDHHRRRLRRPYPFHLSAAGGRCADVGADHHARRPAPGLQTAPTPPPARRRSWHIAKMLEAADGLPMNLGLCRQGQRGPARRAGRDGRGGRLCHEAARRLGPPRRRRIDNCLSVAV